LARAGIDVLLLEAGARTRARGLTFRVQGLTLGKIRGELLQRPHVRKTGDPDAELFEALAPGGLSNHWSCAVPRFAPEDFEDAARAGAEHTWPIGYDTLAPWYDRVEPLLHIAGDPTGSTQLPGGKVLHDRRLADDWSGVVAGARRQGRTIVAMPYAYGAGATLTWSGTPFNAFVRLVEPELRRGKLKVRYGARATRLEWSASQRRVTAVTFQDADSRSEQRVDCRAVVVAGGALNTPEILLQSTSSDFPTGLGNQHDLVGRYLHDHPVGKVVIQLSRAMSVVPAAYLTRLALGRSKTPLYAAACMQWCNTKDLVRSMLKLSPGRLPEIGFSVFGTMRPTRENFVRLDRSQLTKDGVPGLELNIRYPRESLAAIEEARDDVVALLAEAGWDPKVRVWRVEPIGRSNHYAGTCRMHASPEHGVVDSWNRLHGVPNVIVTDSSVFTTNPEKNPVLTSMALAARASDHLASEINGGGL
jgi:choline dehydrogenase-like flavoprotein